MRYLMFLWILTHYCSTELLAISPRQGFVLQARHSEYITSIRWSADSKSLLTGSADGSVKQWDVASGMLELTVPVGDKPSDVAFEPGNSFLVASKCVQKFAPGEEPRDILCPPGVTGLSLFEHGSGLVAAWQSMFQEAIWLVPLRGLGSAGAEAETPLTIPGECSEESAFTREVQSRDSNVSSMPVVFSLGAGRILVASKCRNVVEIWDMKERLRLARYGLPQGAFIDFAPGEKGKFFALTLNGSVLGFQLPEAPTTQNAEDAVPLLKPFLVVAGEPGIEKDIGPAGLPMPVFAVSDQYLVVAPSRKYFKVRLIDGRNGRAIAEVEDQRQAEPKRFRISPDGRQIAAGFPSGEIRVFELPGLVPKSGSFGIEVDLPTGAEVKGDAGSLMLSDFKGRVTIFSREGARYVSDTDLPASEGEFGSVVLDPERGQIVRELSTRELLIQPALEPMKGARFPSTEPLHILRASSDYLVATSIRDSGPTEILVFARSGQLLRRISTKLRNGSVELEAEGDFVAAFSSVDGGLEVWNVKSGALVLSQPQETVISVAFKPGGSMLAVLDMLQGLRLFDSKTGKQVQQLDVSNVAHDSQEPLANFVTWARGDILLGRMTGMIERWSLTERRKSAEYRGHHASINAATLMQDERLISSSRDGSVRIWNKEGQEQARLYLFPENNSWLVHTPQGHFDYSGNEALNAISYHASEGFLPIQDMENQLRIDDLLSKIMLNKYNPGSLPPAERTLSGPPRVKIYTDDDKKLPADKSSIDFWYSVSDNGAGVSRAEVRVNGILISSPHGPFQDRQKAVIPLNCGVNQVSVTAYNGMGGPGAQHVRQFVRAATAADCPRPAMHILAVGTDYKTASGGIPVLGAAERDAKFIAGPFAKAAQDSGLYSRVSVHALIGADAVRSSIWESFEAIKKNAQPQDVVLIYMAGHGATVQRANGGSLFYFLPNDYLGRATSEAYVANNAFTGDLIADSLMAIRAQKVILIIDSCQSGSLQGSLVGVRGQDSANRQMESLANGTGRFIITSASGSERARESPKVGQGVFTYVLMQAFGAGRTQRVGNADRHPRDGIVGIDELGDFIRHKFKEIAREVTDSAEADIQTPVVFDLGRHSLGERVQPFPIARVISGD